MSDDGSHLDGGSESGGTAGLGSDLGNSSMNMDGDVRGSQGSKMSQVAEFGAEDRFAIDDSIFLARTAELSGNLEDMTEAI
jgi:hypothetical protein